MTVITDNVSGFLENIRDEMQLFHKQLVAGENFDVFVMCADGSEHEIERVVPVPPNMLVCECRNGDRIVQHINCVQLRFSKSTSEEELPLPAKLPIGFRAAEPEDSM